MNWTIVGLGNPEKEHKGTRHNIGKDIVVALEEKLPNKVKALTFESYMNDSGRAIARAVKSKKAAQQLIVVHDELDLPLGGVKISYGAGAGGHKGVESIQKALKTKEFVRIRFGISPATPSGKLRKPDSSKVVDFVLGKFKAPELERTKKARKIVGEAIELLATEGLSRAMTEINAK